MYLFGDAYSSPLNYTAAVVERWRPAGMPPTITSGTGDCGMHNSFSGGKIVRRKMLTGQGNIHAEHHTVNSACYGLSLISASPYSTCRVREPSSTDFSGSTFGLRKGLFSIRR